MKWYLLNYKDDYADEFDISGIYVMDEQIYNMFQKALKKMKTNFKTFSFNFGTNEGMEYEDFDRVKKAFEVTKITDEEYKVFQKFDLITIGFAYNFVNAVIGR